MFHIPEYKDLPTYAKGTPHPGAIQSCSKRHQTRHLSRQEFLDAQNHLLLSSISETAKVLQESNTKKWRQFFEKIAQDQIELDKKSAKRRHA
jgi:hypothetical protein